MIKQLIPIARPLIILLLFFIPIKGFSQSEAKIPEKRGYITGTFSSGFGGHFDNAKPQGFGTCVEIIKRGTVDWSVYEGEKADTTVSLPIIFDLKIISPLNFGFTFGDLFTISMNKNYKDANHLYIGLSYVLPIKKWDFGISFIVFPNYVDGDSLIAGKSDVNFRFLGDLGITLTLIYGGTIGWAHDKVFHFSSSLGFSVKI